MKVLQNKANLRFSIEKLHSNPSKIPIPIRHRLQSRSIYEIKIFKNTCFMKKCSAKVLLQHSETDLGLTQNLKRNTLF